MNKKEITFNKSGYDPFIDFIKAYCIICVLIAHILPSELLKYMLFQIWGDMQVPMFVLIQVFHTYKRWTKPKLKWDKILKRICLPFIAVQAFICFSYLKGGNIRWTDLITGGGFGPGSYYIWIYIQLSLLMVIIWPWIKRVSFKHLLISFLLFSICAEIFFSIIDLPDWLYRLLCVRYLLLIPLGIVWINKGVLINRKTVLLSIFSIVAVLFFVFTNYNLEPLFFNTGWKTHRWICYFYLPALFAFGLYFIWDRIRQSPIVEKSVRWLAARTYEIFLAQMAVLVCFPFACFPHALEGIIGYSIWAVLVFSLSLFFGDVIYWFRKI